MFSDADYNYLRLDRVEKKRAVDAVENLHSDDEFRCCGKNACAAKHCTSPNNCFKNFNATQPRQFFPIGFLRRRLRQHKTKCRQREAAKNHRSSRAPNAKLQHHHHENFKPMLIVFFRLQTLTGRPVRTDFSSASQISSAVTASRAVTISGLSPRPTQPTK